MSDIFQPVAPAAKKKPPKKAEPPKPLEVSLRGALREALGNDTQGLDFIVKTLKEACEPTLRVRLTKNEPCPRCNCPHERYVNVPRHKEAVDLAIRLMDQVEGKPGTAEAGASGVVVNWAIKGLDDE